MPDCKNEFPAIDSQSAIRSFKRFAVVCDLQLRFRTSDIMDINIKPFYHFIECCGF